MKRIFLCLFVFVFVIPGFVFAQQGAGALRDYVGLINQTYHPGIVSYFEKAKKEYEKQGEKEMVKLIDLILSGAFGSGFLYNDAKGNLYVITNNHVISQANTISITFERADGTKKKIENLKLIATDVEADLAIMSVPATGEKPFVNQGLNLLTRAVEEGEDAYSAGFPGLGMTPIWQFGRGMVSNASAKFPKSLTDETMMGPYVQHTAQVDSGNSGGPLLVAQRNAPSGYAVAGVNTLSGTRRQAANYAIPISTLQAFINNALNPKPETFKANLDALLDKFVKGLGGNTAVHSHISEFLSTACIGENAEYALEELYKRGPTSAKRAYIEKSREDLISAMGIAVAWTIEDSIRTGSGALKTEIKDVTAAGEEYNVTFTINNKEVKSVWIREYGNWRIKSFGTAATGDTERITKREKQKERDEKLRVNSEFSLEAGYASIFKAGNGSALYLSLTSSIVGINVFYSDDKLSSFGFFGNINIPIPANNLAIVPNFRFGLSYITDDYYKEFKAIIEDKKSDPWGYSSRNDTSFPFIMDFSLFAGLKITTTYVPGLFANVGFQYNIGIIGYEKEYNYPGKFDMALIFAIGYAF
jgi:serine protease Do